MWLLVACAAGPPPPSGEDPSTSGGCPGAGDLTTGLLATSSGPWQGSPSGSGWAFLGLPYAAPPVGDLRFAAPSPPACSEEVRAADTFGAECPQWETWEYTTLVGEEDCLSLNVWTPVTDPGAGLPVLVYLHGGGNVSGSPSAQEDGYRLYDGASLAERFGAVVVTISYRLGALGFLAHPALDETNFGLRDQVAALGWVRDHVSAVGGDPSRVLLFGQSAGAIDTCALYGSPAARGLFSSAAMQSGGCIGTELADARETGATLVECADAACLRALPAEELAALGTSPISEAGVPDPSGFGPVVDGDILPLAPRDGLPAGEVPLLVGSNADETSQWVPPLTVEEYEALVDAAFGAALGAEVLALYPSEAYDSGSEAWIALTTDVYFACPARSYARAAGGTAHRYRFANVPNGAGGAAWGAWHGVELLFVFQHLDEVVEASGYRADEGDYAVEAAMGEAWATLAAGGAPWPAEADEGVQVFDGGAAWETDPRAAYCDFWAALGI